MSATSTLTMTRSKQTARMRRERTPASASARKGCAGVAAENWTWETSSAAAPEPRPQDVGALAAIKSRPAREQVMRYVLARSEEPGGTQGDEDDEQRVDREVAIVDREQRRPAGFGRRR